jgi:hypothetical protein
MPSPVVCITNIYNEEYLLPFWLEHHKNMFDFGIIVNYRCTDRSLEICREICPHWKIIDTNNPDFDIVANTNEFMHIEEQLRGCFKIILNTTEFLVPFKPLKELLQEHDNNQIALNIKTYSPHSLNEYNPKDIKELFKNILNDDVKIDDKDRCVRVLHNYSNGAYNIGRHGTLLPSENTDDACVLWMGFYPLNERLLSRKLQIGTKMTPRDLARGWGGQHIWSKETMLEKNKERYENGKRIQDVSTNLYKYLHNL